MDGIAFWGNGQPFTLRNYMNGFDNNDPGMCFRWIKTHTIT